MAEAAKPPEKDEELEELLDSAIEDFNKPPQPQSSENTKKDVPSQESFEEVPPWSKEFLAEAQKAFENNMKSLLGPAGDSELSPDQFEDQLLKACKEVNKVIDEHSNDPEFSATIAQTLKNLSENQEKMQGEAGADPLAAMFGGLGLGTEEDSTGDFMPFMHSMMQSFLSKEVLYPSIKEITDKYPVWLEEHKATLSEADFTNYQSQFDLMKKLCDEFEKETDSDSEEVKKERFTKVFSIMEEMQKLGQPPKDLVFDENGTPITLPDLDSSQCSIM